MKHPTYPMPNKSLYNGIPLSLNAILYSPGYIVKVISWNSLLNALEKRLKRNIQQMGRAFTNISYRIGSRGVSVKTLKLNTEIYRQNISVKKHTV